MDKTLDELRNDVNNTLVALKVQIANTSTNKTMDAIHSIAPINSNTLDCKALIQTSQDIEASYLTMLTTLSNFVSAMQIYQTVALL